MSKGAQKGIVLILSLSILQESLRNELAGARSRLTALHQEKEHLLMNMKDLQAILDKERRELREGPIPPEPHCPLGPFLHWLPSLRQSCQTKQCRER